MSFSVASQVSTGWKQPNKTWLIKGGRTEKKVPGVSRKLKRTEEEPELSCPVWQKLSWELSSEAGTASPQAIPAPSLCCLGPGLHFWGKRICLAQHWLGDQYLMAICDGAPAWGKGFIKTDGPHDHTVITERGNGKCLGSETEDKAQQGLFQTLLIRRSCLTVVPNNLCCTKQFSWKPRGWRGCVCRG